MLLATATTQAQEPTNTTSIPNFNHSISFEIGAPNNLLGVNYDRRLKQGSPWGVRTGFGFGFYKNNFYGLGGESTYCYNIPLEVNLLLGEKKSKCEAGLGVNVGLYNDQYDITLPATNSKGDVKFKTVQEKKNKVDAFAYLNIGYRHVANNDFVFCAGVTPHSSFSPTRATTEAKWALCPTSTWAKHSKCNTAYDFSLANTVHRLRFSFHVFETVRETMHASSLHCYHTII